MHVHPFPALAWWLSDYPLIIPAMGVAVACAAFVFGRRLLQSRSASSAPAPPSASKPKARGKSTAKVDVFVHGSVSERRVAPRRRGNSVEVLITEHPEEPAVRGWVVDRSVGGLCVLVDQPLEKQVPMLVRPYNCPASTPWTTVDILNCRADHEGWKVHCHFPRTPDYNVLLLFG